MGLTGHVRRVGIARGEKLRQVVERTSTSLHLGTGWPGWPVVLRADVGYEAGLAGGSGAREKAQGVEVTV
ncbi:MAG TPA: hypothetical protein VNM72_01695 [Blastocatellia bacterium]|nr:hypothetical protein [Blastocatellia bacterium]